MVDILYASTVSAYSNKSSKKISYYKYYSIIINNNKQRSAVFINVKFNSIPTRHRIYHHKNLCARVHVTLFVYDYAKSGCKVCRCENFCHANTRDDVASESEIKSSPHLVIILYSAQKNAHEFGENFINSSIGRLRGTLLN